MHVKSLVACALLVVLLPTGGCYVLQAARGQAQIATRSEPIAKLLDDPALPAATRARLELVREVREFAVHELGLPDGRSFQRYADLERQYALWNVVAAPEFSVEPRRWCFPVAGCVAYRGYFAEVQARDYAERLERRGDDVSVGGIATYSTLGHFADPVLNTMLGWSELRLAGTVIHEMAHERIYVRGDSAFNEAVAVVVEEQGLRQWLIANGRTAELANVDLMRGRAAEFSALLRESRVRLTTLYASGAPAAQLRIDKQREFGRLKYQYTQLRASWGGYRGYDHWFARTLNNSHLVAVGTYQDCVPALEREFAAAGSFAAFFVRADALAALSTAQRAAFCAAT